MLRINAGRIINGRKLLRVCAVVLTAGAFFTAPAITRWSTLQLVPGADMIPSGKFVVDADFAWAVDTFSFSDVSYIQRIHLGFSEWVGADVGGNAEGFIMGMKARVLKENMELWYTPTLSLGVQNLYMSREGFYFGYEDDYPRNEFYIVAAKSSDWAKLRGHVGIMSAATGRDDRFNPFFGFEKYFGQGMYITVEGQRRTNEFLLSAFAVYRPFADKLEINLGVVDAPGILGRTSAKPFHAVLRAGVRVLLGSGFNGFDGLTGVEDRIDRQGGSIAVLNRRIDSLQVELRWNADRIHQLGGFPDDRREERARVMDELVMLRNLYDQEPFDPELVKDMLERIRNRYEVYAPHLRVIVTEPDVNPRIRRLAVTLIGEMGDREAANILISILNRFEEPALKIETMSALGKLRETRAQPILLRLRNDPDGGVAFTAAEVYRSLFGDDGGQVRPPSGPAAEIDPVGNTVPERRLGH